MTTTSDLNNQLWGFYRSKWPAIVAGLRERPTLSPPHLIELNDRYINAKKRVLLVGQEANRWHIENQIPTDSDDDLRELLRCYSGFDLAKDYRHKNSPFWKGLWRFAECLAREEPDPRWFAWSNIVKTDRRGTQNKGGGYRGLRPHASDEDWIASFELVQGEIRILNPEVVVFFIGPYYCDRLEKTFPGVSYTRPSTASLWSRVLHPVLPQHSYLTYHPSYLWRSGRRSVIEQMAIQIMNGR